MTGSRAKRYAAALAAVLLLAGCATVTPPGPPPTPSPSATPSTAALLGVERGPAIASLGLGASDAAAALASFAESCGALLRREDGSGLTRARDWEAACTAARTASPATAPAFFAQWFETARIGSGEAFATGYFEPVIAGVRERDRRVGFDVPVYGLPVDLVRDPNWTGNGRAPLGKVTPDGFAPYDTRAQIAAGSLLPSGEPKVWLQGMERVPPALNARAPVLGYAADPIAFFFLQIQGSGILRAPDGSDLRIGYAGQNGHGYTAIGRIMRERGLIGDGTPYATSMQGIVGWLHDHPDQADEVMNTNESWVFFRELTGDGPLGALGVPVRRESSVAADPAYVPLGAPVWLDMDRPEADGLWIAQDTGGAIKGANRFDTFWGNALDAAAIAGGMSARGRALLFLPKGTLDRLGIR